MSNAQTAEFEKRFNELVKAFASDSPLRVRTLYVLGHLPADIQDDFLNDAYFQITLDNCEPGQGRIVMMPAMNPAGGESRCVVLKPRLATCNEAYAHYIIAHEFAHAVLRNGGWGQITDREEAADALAASWGFRNPAR